MRFDLLQDERGPVAEGGPARARRLFGRLYLVLSVAMTWSGIALATWLLGAWRLEWPAGLPHGVTVIGLVALATGVGLAVGRRAAPRIASRRWHALIAGPLGGLAVYGAIVAAIWLGCVAYALFGEVPTGRHRLTSAQLRTDGAFLLWMGSYGIMPAAVLGLVHGALAMLLRRLVLPRRRPRVR